MAPPLLELRSVGWSCRSFALRDIDLSLGAGDYACLVGPTGSGKTVLLELIAGLRRPGSGTILYRGDDATSSPPEERSIGFSYQDSLLFPFLSARENILFGARARGLGADEKVMRRYRGIVEALGIGDIQDRRPRFLSGGERQRVSLARAILPGSPLLLLDEPLASLDRPRRIALREVLAEVHRREGVAILHATHDGEEVRELATKLVALRAGRIASQGGTEEVLAGSEREFVLGLVGPAGGGAGAL